MNDKQTIQSQYYYAVNNREVAALNRKRNPIIEALDKPEGPYIYPVQNPMIYAIIGVMLGIIIGAIALLEK